MTVVQTHLPTVGAGALKSREDPNERAGKVSLVCYSICLCLDAHIGRSLQQRVYDTLCPVTLKD